MNSSTDARIRTLRRRLETNNDPKTFIRMSDFQAQIRDQLVVAIGLGQLLVEANNCPVCGRTDGDIVSTSERMGIPLKTAICSGCPTMYSTTRFDTESMTSFYSKWYRKLSTGRQEPGVGFREMQAAAGRTLLKYLSGVGVLKNSPARVLDVGCGAGGTLEPFLEIGFDCVGIDLDSTFLEGGRRTGIHLENVRLEDFRSDKPFDLVILDDVIEHLAVPPIGLMSVRSLLSDDGLVACQVPVLNTLRELGYRNDLRRYFQLAHVNHFSITGLSALFARAGMSLIAFDGVGQFVFRANRNIKETSEVDLLASRDSLLSHLARVTKMRSYYSARESIASRVPVGLRRIGRPK